MGAAERTTRRVPRVWFAALVLGTAASTLGGGLWLYLTHAPTLRTPGLGLAVPGAWNGQDPADVVASVRWNLVFVAGYGTALLLATQTARWTFWTPKAAAAARLGRYATWTAVVMASAENLAIVRAAHEEAPAASRWAAVAAVLATVKWASLVPASLVAVLGTLVTTTRLLRAAGRGLLTRVPNRSPARRRAWLAPGAVVVPVPRERPAAGPPSPRCRRALRDRSLVRRAVDAATFEWPPAPDPDTGSIATDPAPATAAAEEQRWERAYNVPSLTADELGDPGREAVGICLSGGGIRSASLALGALGPLRQELLRARYLVSISGGGFTAGALAQALTGAGDRAAGADAGTGERWVHDAEHAYLPGTVELDHVRRHSSYLGSTTPETLVALGVLARGMVATLLLVFLPSVVLGVAAAWYLHTVPVLTLPTFGASPAPGTAGHVPDAVWWALAACWAAALACWLAETVLANGSRRLRQIGVDRARGAAVVATHIAMVLVVVTLGVFGAARFASWVGEHVTHGARFGVGTSLGTVLLTYAAGLASLAWRRRRTLQGAVSAIRREPGRRRAAVPQGLLQMLLVAVSLGVLAVAWVLLFGVSAVWSATSLAGDGGDRRATLLLALAAAGVVAVLGGCFDETSMSLHPFYRHRIASAFATRVAERGAAGPGPADAGSGGRGPGGHGIRLAVPYAQAEVTTLSDYGRVAAESGPFPELVFACTANLTGEDRTPPGFTGTSFTMGADWVGGPDVGWVRTGDLEAFVPRRLLRDLTVQGAVAISAAAVASSMGRMSRWYQVLLALTGARLGAWLPNPTFVEALRTARRPDGVVEDWTLPWLPGVRRMTYLLRELLNVHPAEERLLHVTDGGHYENLGIVEALRRRSTTIYCVDGGGDLPPTAQGLAQAIDLAYSELGVTVTLDDPMSSEPGSGRLDGATPALAPLASTLVATPVITGTFTYPASSGLPPERRTGRLVVGRALLWSGLPYNLLAYAVQAPTFPHDSTSDQWFSDDQFTAYTELGRQVGAVMAAADVTVPDAAAGDQEPAPVESCTGEPAGDPPTAASCEPPACPRAGRGALAVVPGHQPAGPPGRIGGDRHRYRPVGRSVTDPATDER